MKELAWEIGETARALRRFYDRRAAALGVTTAQWKVIAHIGNAPGLRQVELAERLDIEPMTACRIVDRLEDAGLIERQNDPDDRRAWRLALTERAVPIFERLSDLADEMAEIAFADFTTEEKEAARAKLARIRDNVSQADAGKRKSA